MSAEFLHHEAADARAGVEHGEDEKRLEHDREVIPDAEQAFAADRAAENLRHADGERGRAAGAVEQRVLADALREGGHGLRVERVAPARELWRPQRRPSCRRFRRGY